MQVQFQTAAEDKLDASVILHQVSNGLEAPLDVRRHQVYPGTREKPRIQKALAKRGLHQLEISHQKDMVVMEVLGWSQ